MKNILFVGSNPDKISHIKPARDMGHRLILLKDKIKPEDKKLFDITIEANLYDINDTEKKLSKHKIDACLTRFEPWVPIVGMICEKHNLKGPSLISSMNSRDKLMMREAFEKAKVPQPKFKKIITLKDLNDASNYLGFPFLLKPLSGAKSRYIIKINNKEEIKNAFKIVSESTKSNQGTLFSNIKGINMNDFNTTFLAEEIITGKQVTTTSYIVDGKVYHIALADLITAQDKNINAFYLISRTTPSTLDQKIQEKIKEISSKAILALGLNNTPVHPELILTKDGPKILEVGARIGGYRTEMTYFANGIKLNKIAIDIALGNPIENKIIKNKASTAYEIWPKKTGIIKNYNKEIFNKFQAPIWAIKKRIGEKFITPPIGEKHIAHFVIEEPDPINSIKKAQLIEKEFNVEII